MRDTDQLVALFEGSRWNTLLSWLFVAVLVGNALGGLARGRYEPVLFGLVAIALVVGPAVAFRDPTVMPPWHFLTVICLPVLWGTVAPYEFVTAIVPSLSMATLGLLLVVDLHLFTALRVVPSFAVALTVLITLAMAGVLNILQWSSDVLLGTSFLLDGRTQDAINAAVMVECLYVAVAGFLAGLVFYAYFRRVPDGRGSRVASAPPSESETPARAAVLSDRLGLSATRQLQLAASMQTILGIVLVYGAWTRQLPLVVNAGATLAITFVPAVLERDYAIPMEPGLVLWVTSAVFLHALGSAWLYGVVPQWDTITHTLSATVVAAAGYTTLRAIHLHAESIHLPPWAMFAVTLVFVLAMGVIWELVEFFIDQAALLLGIDPVLAQHGINDTIVDLLFDAVGAVLVATWGTVYLVGISEHLALQLERRIDA